MCTKQQTDEPADVDLADAGCLREGLEAGDVGVWRWEMASGRLYWSPNLQSIHGLAQGRFDGTFSFFSEDIHPDDRQRVRETIERSLAEGRDYYVQYRLPEKPGGETRWLEARGRVLRDGGAIIGMTGICQSITDRKRDEAELALRVRQQETVARLGRLALGDFDEAALLSLVSESVCEALDADMCKILELMPGGIELLLRAGTGWDEGLVGTMRLDIARGSQAGYTLRADAPVVTENLAAETRFVAGPLLEPHGVAAGISVVIMGDDGRPFGVIGAHTRKARRFRQSDIDFVHSVANVVAAAMQRVRVRQGQQLLIRELRHRVGNLLSMILSLFNNSVSSAASVDELKDKFQARVMSLSRAHSLISQGGWRSASLSSLIDEVLAPYRERIVAAGDDVVLPADGAFALGLALHELATNAAKYGALTAPRGQLALEWCRECHDDRSVLSLAWVESGGPDVAPPERRGFGSRLVTTVVESQLNGTIDIAFERTGLRVHMRVPLDER